MELRPCALGTEYHGPVRVPVARPSGAQTFSGISYRPTRQFWRLRPADYAQKAKHYQQMAEQRRAERKAQQEHVKIYGPEISVEDDGNEPLGSDCKVLKQLEYDGKVRLYFRRKE